MPTVKFSDLDEFIEEIRKDTDLIDRKIIRVTNSWQRQSPFTTWAIKASVVIEGTVVCLESRCGEYMGPQPDREVQDKATARMELLNTVAGELGLEIRAGRFEEK